MKQLTFIILSVAFTEMISNANAQTKAKTDSCYQGVYIAYEDFIKNQLSYKVKRKMKGTRFGFAFPTKTIRIVRPDTTVKFRTGSIYGYFDCGSFYRYSPDVELLSPEDYYKIEEMGGEELGRLVIYTSVFMGGAEHFYSVRLNSPIHRLNINHLREDFEGPAPEFIKAVKKMTSENEGDIAAKDTKGNFLINKLYQQFVIR